jgi:hypothetical protein
MSTRRLGATASKGAPAPSGTTRKLFGTTSPAAKHKRRANEEDAPSVDVDRLWQSIKLQTRQQAPKEQGG